MNLFTKKPPVVSIAYFFIDLALIYVSFILPLILYVYVSHKNIPPRIHILAIYAAWAIILLLLLLKNNLYGTRREASIFRETAAVFKAVILSGLIILPVIYLQRLLAVPRSVYIVNIAMLFVSLAVWRALKRLMIRHLISKGYNNFNVLIIGAGKAGAALALEIDKRPYLGLKIIGFLDDCKDTASPIGGYKIIGNLSDFEKIVRQNFIDETFVTAHLDRQKTAKIIQEGLLVNASVKFMSDAFDLPLGLAPRYVMGDLSFLEYASRRRHGTELPGKRFMDLVLAFFGALLFLPFIAIAGLLIKISSPGPIFYSSRRYGKKGKLFNMYKLRSMDVNADQLLEALKEENEAEEPLFKIKTDPRITKIGRFLRRYSLDELPQLWNVVRGDMSIVGPRPLPVGQVDRNDLSQLDRLLIKPGMTGLWQIHGRSDASFDILIRWDLWYIKHWTPWLDMFIISKTIPAVFAGRGAY